ncbi:LEAF RUST 10 DISEASE-RESISTANCE LOCUS RECEPTOR-LIKE PROTEIN KINASE-like 2.4, partial [Cucurbita argyrosperma subsp. argyrosperma]
MDHSPIPYFLLIFSFSHLLLVFGDPFDSCSNRFNCRNITDVGFPFWGDQRPADCGHPALKLTCEGGNTTIVIKEIKYQILKFSSVNDSLRLTIARDDYMDDLCPNKFINTTIDYNLFDTIPNYRNITLLYCSTSPVAGQFTCPDYEFGLIQLNPVASSLCNVSVIVPVSLDSFPQVSDLVNSSEILKAIKEGFEVRLKKDSGGCGICEESNGVCGYDWSLNQTTCYCRHGAYNDNGACQSTPAGGSPSSSPGLSVGGAAVLGLCLGCCVFCIKQRKKTHVLKKLKTQDLPSPPSSAGTLAPSTKRVEQFMNEIEILSQLQHPNLVKLYGCTSRHSQELILVYEYIPNGTVADHLHGKRANSDPELGFERDYAVRCMITSVAELAVQCLQQSRDVRPSMDEVLEVLREIEHDEMAARKAEVLDIGGSDNVRLLRKASSLLSPDSGAVTDKWVTTFFS